MPLIDIHVASRRPFADGASFGPAGTYDRLDGEMTFAVDPTNPANAGIVDLAAAPRDAEQRVRFRSDFSLLLPTDAEGRRRLLVELPNRGRRLWGRFNGASPDVALSLQDDPGDGFLRVGRDLGNGEQVADHDIAARAGELGRDSAADASRATGDDGDLVFELHGQSAPETGTSMPESAALAKTTR